LVSLHAQRALERLGDVLVVLHHEDAWRTCVFVHVVCVVVAPKAMVRPTGRVRETGVEVAHDARRPKTHPLEPLGVPARRQSAAAPRTSRALPLGALAALAAALAPGAAARARPARPRRARPGTAPGARAAA